MPSGQDAENVDQCVSRDDTADPSCHAAVATPMQPAGHGMAQQPAPLLPLVISNKVQLVPPEQPQQIHLVTQPPISRAPISSDLDDMYEHFKKLQKYTRAINKEVEKLRDEKEDHMEVILEIQKERD